jgi:WD40 repeat protein
VKLEVAGVDRLIEDLAPLREDAEARKLAGALRLAAHVLNREPRQLAGQLLGRLSSADGPTIGALLSAVRTRADRPSLAPVRRSLIPPGGPLLATLAGHGDGVTAVAVTADGRRAVSGSDDATLKVWDLEQGALLSTLEGHGGRVLAVAVTADGRRAVSGSNDRTLRLWDLATAKQLAAFTCDAAFLRCAVTPEGRFAVAGDSLGQIHVLEILL